MVLLEKMDLVTIYAGAPWRVALIEAELAAEGVPCFVPDRLTKTLDPFITGSNALDLRLEVPENFAADARAILAAWEAETENTPPEDPAEARAREVAKMGMRIRWAALFWITSPFALYYALPYLRAVAALGCKPRGHRLTIAAMPLALLMCILGIILLTT